MKLRCFFRGKRFQCAIIGAVVYDGKRIRFESAPVKITRETQCAIIVKTVCLGIGGTKNAIPLIAFLTQIDPPIALGGHRLACTAPSLLRHIREIDKITALMKRLSLGIKKSNCCAAGCELIAIDAPLVLWRITGKRRSRYRDAATCQGLQHAVFNGAGYFFALLQLGLASIRIEKFKPTAPPGIFRKVKSCTDQIGKNILRCSIGHDSRTQKPKAKDESSETNTEGSQ